ncbi:MAG: malto-oligosyltrehalose trehalohydrolase [Planctomycetaceae bacterium]
MSTSLRRRLPFGAELTEAGIEFRVWAPRRTKVAAKIAGVDELVPLTSDGTGYFSGTYQGGGAGTRYCFRLDDESYDYPDPASRYQPDGVHGMSELIDPDAYIWNDLDWKGIELAGQVIYELHLGCFTPKGTWRAAEEKFSHLREMGVTVLEIMPVAEFDGEFGWGYDGVKWYAPSRLYGTPDDFRHFVDTAHQHGLAVILDVVYNHFGPSGNYTGAYSSHFISQRHSTEWGDALNFDGEGCQGVRDFVVQNAAYWINEYHLDGLRLDATQSIYDDSQCHLLADLSTAARSAAGDRKIILIAENDTRDVRHVEATDEGGYGLDGLWNDDFHHACRVAATGHAEYYYADFSGTSQELISSTKWGYLFQGQYAHQSKQRRGTPAWHLPAWRFVTYLQNHDQVANSAHGSRLPDLTSPGSYRALTTLWLLGPGTPMFFMGQEFGTRAPFRYFADHRVPVAEMVREGRWESLRQFPRIAGWEGSTVPLPDPSAQSTYEDCKLDWSECEVRLGDRRMHRDLLRLRREDATISRQDKSMIHGAVVNPDCFILRWHNPSSPAGGEDRLLLFNLGRDYHWQPSAEPLIAPAAGARWEIMFSSEDAIYGGSGTALLDMADWYIPGHAAILLKPSA